MLISLEGASTKRKEVEMKFLILIEGVPGGPPMPPEQFLAFSKENMAWARRMKESGRSEVQYALADHAGGLMGGFCVHNVDSAEQLAEDLATLPAAGLSTVKVYPLVAVEVTEKLIKGWEAQLAKKKK
jgi:muconolactone delta-isomerase